MEPKRRKQTNQQTLQESNSPPVQAISTSDRASAITSIAESMTASAAGSGSRTDLGQQQEHIPSQKGAQGPQRSTGGRELRRARIVITVRRTESYKQWLQENPLQAIIAGHTEGGEDGSNPPETLPGQSATI